MLHIISKSKIADLLYQYFFCERGSTATTQSALVSPAGLLLRVGRECNEVAGLLERLLGCTGPEQMHRCEIRNYYSNARIIAMIPTQIHSYVPLAGDVNIPLKSVCDDDDVEA